MITVLALLGAKSLVILYVWLLSAAIASYLSHRKGFGERPGLASGMILPIIGPLAWLFWPARDESLWKKVGPIGRPKSEDIAAAAAAEKGKSIDPAPAAPHATDAETAATAPTSGDTRPESADTTERP